MELRDYQQEAVDSIFNYYRSGNTGNPLVVAATGSGKSLIIGEFVRRAMTEFPGQRLVMATHVKELVQQNYEKLMHFWPEAEAGIYSASLKKKQPKQAIVLGTVQSMVRATDRLGWRSLMLVDECHLIGPNEASQYQKLIANLKAMCPSLKVIGFTATPWRMKGGHLILQKNAIFTDICYKIGIKKLTEQGYLAPLTSKSSAIQADLTGVKTVAGEYNAKQAEAAIDDDELTEAALDEVEVLAADRKTILFFCAGVNHAKHVDDKLIRRGWRSAVVSYKSTPEERDDAIEGLKTGHYRALCNNAVLTTGVDIPNIDCIVLLRATKSPGLYIQMLGRGSRLADGKENCLVLDYCGNIERFGAVDLIESPTILAENIDSKPEAPPQKICPNCRQPVLAAVTECPHCGHEFPREIIHDTRASRGAVASHDQAEEWVDVAHVQYNEHISRKTNIPLLRVEYLNSIGWPLATDWICVYHDGYAGEKAQKWLRRNNVPTEAVKNIGALVIYCERNVPPPNKILVKKNGKYMEVKGYG